MLPDMETILVITTGGTIDKVYFDAKSDFEVGHSMVRELLKEAHVGIDYEIVEVMRKDSLDIDAQDRALIRAAVQAGLRAGRTRIIITHGTDTMTETSAALADLVGIPSVTEAQRARIVLTGSLSPARFARSDATFNVGMAFATVQSAVAGIYIVMNGQVFDGLAVKKDRVQNSFVPLERDKSDQKC
jgi:L-asparaginase